MPLPNCDVPQCLIRVGSHRARERLIKLLGYLPQGFFNWHRPGEWRQVSLVELQKIKDAKVKGISFPFRLKKEDLRSCVQWD